jgi:signal transduction histidine kinase
VVFVTCPWCLHTMADIGNKNENSEKSIALLEKGYQAILEFIDQMDEISQLQDKIDITANINQIWTVLLHEIQNSIVMEGCALFLVDDQSHEFVLKNASPLSMGSVYQNEIEHQIECGMFSWIINRRKPALLPALVLKSKKTIIMLPLVTAKHTLGVVLVITAIEESAITQENMKLLAMLAKQCSLVMENSLLYDRLRNDHESLQKAQRQILQAEKLASIGRLTAGASHEILNPLNILSGYIQMLTLQGNPDERTARYLTIMNEQAERISRIVNGLYQFSQAAGSNKDTVQINALIRKVFQLFEHEHKYDHIRNIMNLEEYLPSIQGNVDTLSQVFFIMLSNARDAMPKGGELSISTRRVPSEDTVEGIGNWIEIQFRDTGHGIPEAEIDRIFDPFFTTKASKNGTGLGLSLSYGIIQNHGGTIHVESQVNKGTTFTIRLPCY